MPLYSNSAEFIFLARLTSLCFVSPQLPLVPLRPVDGVLDFLPTGETLTVVQLDPTAVFYYSFLKPVSKLAYTFDNALPAMFIDDAITGVLL